MIGYTQKINVDVHDVDYNGVCRVSSLMRYLQSTAQMQLTDKGLSYEELRRRGRAFIISRIRLEFSAPVYTYDELEALTFPCESRGYSFLRCYQLSRGEECIGRAVSVWALIDTESHSLVRVNDFELGLTTYEPPSDLVLGHIHMPSTLVEVGEYKVCYADIDQNRHVSNTKYPDIFANFLPMDGKRIASISINYANEAKQGELLRVLCAKLDNCYYIRTVKPDGKINAEAEITPTEL